MAVNQEFYHHGVKGQKWGVRRYRNTDGSLTPAGKKRAAKLNKAADKSFDRSEKRFAKKFGKLEAKSNKNPILKYEYKKQKLLIKREASKSLHDLQKKEIADGEVYLERKVKRNVTIAAVAAPPTLKAFSANAALAGTIVKNRRQVDRRKPIAAEMDYKKTVLNKQKDLNYRMNKLPSDKATFVVPKQYQKEYKKLQNDWKSKGEWEQINSDTWRRTAKRKRSTK